MPFEIREATQAFSVESIPHTVRRTTVTVGRTIDEIGSDTWIKAAPEMLNHRGNET